MKKYNFSQKTAEFAKNRLELDSSSPQKNELATFCAKKTFNGVRSKIN